jgi:nicotinic acid mononucleotide adenylyltransferase
MKDFADKLNASSWRGVISEVGVGMPFSAEFVSIPGASKTILHTDCPYVDIERPGDMRAVSLENVKRVAHVNLAKARKIVSQTAYANVEHLFGLSISGAHYNDRDSHMFMYLATPKWDAYMHFSIAANSDRVEVGRIAIDYIMWFLTGCLLSKEPWSVQIERLRRSLLKNNVDILYAPGVSDTERLLLLTPNNPLVYANGAFQRVMDYIRACPTIYPGSFNPPTRFHLSVRSCLFEISQTHTHKHTISTEDMLHRVRMLAAVDRPVLLTQTPYFVDKYKLLEKYMPDSGITFVMGADVWNLLVQPHLYPSHQWLSEQMPKAKFLVLPRAGHNVNKFLNPISEYLKWEYVEENAEECSSTAVRESEVPSDHDFLADRVQEYVKKHGLYLTPPE